MWFISKYIKKMLNCLKRNSELGIKRLENDQFCFSLSFSVNLL